MAFYRDAGSAKGPAFLLAIAAMASTGLALLLPCRPAAAQTPLPSVTLRIGAHGVQAELADTPQALREGLMHRKSLPTNTGMLFKLGAPDIYCFWMKNTLIPLSIAFIDDRQRIVDIQDMQPRSLDPHCPAAPVTMALEMSQGWFRRANIQVGERVLGIPDEDIRP